MWGLEIPFNTDLTPLLCAQAMEMLIKASLADVLVTEQFVFGCTCCASRKSAALRIWGLCSLSHIYFMIMMLYDNDILY